MKKRLDKIRHRSAALVGFDLLMFLGVSALLLFIHDGAGGLVPRIGMSLILYTPVLVMRSVLKTYRQVWRYATAEEYLDYVLADLAGGLIYILLLRPLLTDTLWIAYWQAIAIVAVNCLASLAARFLYQCLYRGSKLSHVHSLVAERPGDNGFKVKVAIVGAGSAGFFLARELQINERSRYTARFFIDNDPQKVGSIVGGLRVCAEADAFDRLAAEDIRDVIITVPGCAGEKKQYLFDLYTQHGLRVLIYDLPFVESGRSGSDFGRYDDRSGKLVLRQFRIEDLLFREPVRVNDRKAAGYYRDKTILITGGGGSIGSEIVRQLAACRPRKIIVMDCYENNAYDIQQEMRIAYGDALDLAVEISSVRDSRRMEEIMADYRPDVVVHAAAHKHVPLMEHNSSEAIKNNVFGTLNTVNAAEKYGVKKFILISTDKAVNPTSVMGASKQVCEMIVRSRRDRGAAQGAGGTEFMAVRFGNVLGSNGSVIPLFKRQIANGGPVTITDRRIIRYFMTIPEAAQLVLEAGAMAKNGELYALDMGKPVQILKLAEDMIRLSGYEPYKDIEIRETGLREGEKLYEELLIQSEELDKTDNELIFVERDKGLTRAGMERDLALLQAALDDGGGEAIRQALHQIVPSYQNGADAQSPAPAQTAEPAKEYSVLH